MLMKLKKRRVLLPLGQLCVHVFPDHLFLLLMLKYLHTFRLVLHKMREGTIDGLTLVFSHEIGQWKPLSEVTELREMVNKLDADEEKARAATTSSSMTTSVGAEQMVFIPDEDDESRVCCILHSFLLILAHNLYCNLV